MARKVFIALIFLLFLAVFPAVASSGQNTSTPNNSYAATFLDNLISNLTTSVAGAYNESGGLLQPGAITFFAQGIDTMVSLRPASGLDFARYLSGQLQFPGTPKAAYAQSTGGIGYSSLTPLLPFWLMMRNIAYWFFSIAFVVAGLMIMFRFKIDPKTAATIQSALPKIVFALLLVTFSYAIAGFLIDIMYVAIGLILNFIVKTSGSVPGWSDFAETLARRSIFGIWFEGGPTLANGASIAVGQITSEFLKNTLFQAGGQLMSLITGSIAGLIVAIALLWVLFKTWLMLLNAYANIILNIIFAPVILMLDAIPGQNQFEGWLRNMLAYTLSFPAVILMLFIGIALSASMDFAPDKGGFVPPLVGGNSLAAIQGIVGIAIVFTIPKTVEALQQILKTPENKFGSAWSEALGWSWNQVSSRASGAAGRGSKYAVNEAFGSDTDLWRARKKYELEMAAKGTPVAAGSPSAKARIGSWLGAGKSP